MNNVKINHGFLICFYLNLSLTINCSSLGKSYSYIVKFSLRYTHYLLSSIIESHNYSKPLSERVQVDYFLVFLQQGLSFKSFFFSLITIQVVICDSCKNYIILIIEYVCYRLL